MLQALHVACLKAMMLYITNNLFILTICLRWCKNRFSRREKPGCDQGCQCGIEVYNGLTFWWSNARSNDWQYRELELKWWMKTETMLDWSSCSSIHFLLPFHFPLQCGNFLGHKNGHLNITPNISLISISVHEIFSVFSSTTTLP